MSFFGTRYIRMLDVYLVPDGLRTVPGTKKRESVPGTDLGERSARYGKFIVVYRVRIEIRREMNRGKRGGNVYD